MFKAIFSTSGILTPDLLAQVHTTVYTALQAAVLVVSAGAAWLIKLGISKLNGDLQKSMATRLVAFAEQKFEPSGEKRAYVAANLAKKFPLLTPEEIDHLLEEAVMNLEALTSAPAVTVTPQITVVPPSSVLETSAKVPPAA